MLTNASTRNILDRKHGHANINIMETVQATQKGPVIDTQEKNSHDYTKTQK
jgi:hypothetical protein